MVYLLKMVIFHSHVSLPEGNHADDQLVDPFKTMGRWDPLSLPSFTSFMLCASDNSTSANPDGHHGSVFLKATYINPEKISKC